MSDPSQQAARVAEALSLPKVLRSGRQADPDGVEVRISRQAVEEAASHLEDLLALVRKLAHECAECGGSAERICSFGPGPLDEYAVPCPECADIWTVINKVEGRS